MNTRSNSSVRDLSLILSHSDWNMADDRWTWSVYLRRREDGRYTLNLVQTVEKPPEVRVPGLTGFLKGEKLYSFLQSAWYEHTGVSLDEKDWLEISRRIAAIDSRLAGEVLVAVQAAFDPAPPKAVKLKKWEVHASKAKWAPSHFTTGLGGMRAMAEHAYKKVRIDSVRRYVQAYMKVHGSLPVGVHQVKLDPSSDGSSIRSIRGSPPPVVFFEVTFPPA